MTDAHVTLGWQPKWFIKDGKLIENPDYVEPEPSLEEHDYTEGCAGAWRFDTTYGATLLQVTKKPSWWKRKLAKISVGCEWEDYK